MVIELTAFVLFQEHFARLHYPVHIGKLPVVVIPPKSLRSEVLVVHQGEVVLEELEELDVLDHRPLSPVDVRVK